MHKKKRVPIATQNYFSGAHMEGSMHDLTKKCSNIKKKWPHPTLTIKWVVSVLNLDIKYIIMFLNKNISIGDVYNFKIMLSNEIFKKKIKIMHAITWKNHPFWYSDVANIRHCCGVYTYPQFYYQYFKRFQMLPHLYQNIYSGKNGDKLLKEKWLIYLAQEIENVVLGSINQMGTMKYW